MNKRVFLIHGWDGRSNNHWFPWLIAELKARYFAVDAISMPTPATPHLKDWLGAIKEAVGTPDEHTYFVGHSLGCVTIVRYLESLPKKAKVGGAVLVAGFSGNISSPELAEFYATPERPIDFARVKSICPKIMTIFSDDDPVVPLVKGISFAKSIGAKVIIEKGKGHFCKDDGVTALPVVLETLTNFTHER
ncbi:MAG: hypothetical protein RLZZ347_392 [Candidatus Parcubacteria bacterium]|jgi:predicted alpha/beta hydrolase family esterase